MEARVAVPTVVTRLAPGKQVLQLLQRERHVEVLSAKETPSAVRLGTASVSLSIAASALPEQMMSICTKRNGVLPQSRPHRSSTRDPSGRPTGRRDARSILEPTQTGGKEGSGPRTFR